MCKQLLYKNARSKIKSEPTTIDMVDLKPNQLATRSVLVEWQTDHLIRTASCKVVQWNKFWNKKIHGWFHSHFINEKIYKVVWWSPSSARVDSSRILRFSFRPGSGPRVKNWRRAGSKVIFNIYQRQKCVWSFLSKIICEFQLVNS